MEQAGQAVCRVCGSREARGMRTVDAAYSRCGQCGTLQKLMTREQYEAMDPGYDPGSYLASKSEHDIREHLHVDALRKRLTTILAQNGIDPAGKSFLDIGCGMGGYMLAARDLGMTVRGFEPSVNHGNVATEVLHLPVTKDYFASAKVLPETFDVILLSHVIEHIYEPAEFVSDLVKALNPGGLLIMITPNAASHAARLSGKEWPMLVPIDHVTLLAPGAIAPITPAGYRHSVRTYEFPFEMMAILASIAKRAVRGRATNHPGMAAATDQKTLQAPSLRGKLVRGALTVANLPFHLAARATNKQAALVIAIRAPG